MISRSILCRPFLGRSDELNHLLARRREAAGGRGGLVLVAGEPGIGKSRLVREFRERLNRRTAAIAFSGCRSFAQKPLGPLFDVLEIIAPAKIDSRPSSSKEERVDALAAQFEMASAKRLCVVALEDLHWASIDLMQMLLVLARRAASKRLLFVGTYRDNELVPAHPLFRWFGELFREPAVSVVTLDRFDPDETDRLIRLALGDGAKLSSTVARAVRERSDGNPLFAEELLRSAVDMQRSRASPSPYALPISLHAIIRDRLRACTDNELATLKRAAVVGRAFSLERLAAVFGGDAAKLRAAMVRLNELQLVDPIDAARGRYQFRHALTRDVVYTEMPVEIVRPIHLMIASHLECSPEASGLAEDIAHHFQHANRSERAAPYYESAGDSAMSVFAYSDAAVFYERAANGYECDAAARERVTARAARALIFAGELDEGLAQYERSVEGALELQDVGTAVRNRALMAGHLFDGGRTGDAIALIRKTLALAKSGGTSLQGRLLTRLAMMLAREGRLEEARDALRRVDPPTLELDADANAEYCLAASELHAMSAELGLWRSRFEEGLAIYEARGHPGPLQIAHSNFAVQALCIGEMDLARAHHRTAGELGRVLKLEDQGILPAAVEFFAGNLGEARRIVASVRPSRNFLMRATRMQVAIPLAIAVGDDDMLTAYFDLESLAVAGHKELTATLGRVAAAHAIALGAKGRSREATALLERVLDSMKSCYGMVLPVVAVATLLPQRAAELRPLVFAGARLPGDRVNKALLALLDADWRDAAARFRSLGWPLFEANALEIAGDRDTALAIYLRCGATGYARHLEVRAMRNARGVTLGLLTARERELALLVADGKPNRVAAAELSITEKAVEKYLTSIYAKFGLRSRAQLAALVASSLARTDRS